MKELHLIYDFSDTPIQFKPLLILGLIALLGIYSYFNNKNKKEEGKILFRTMPADKVRNIASIWCIFSIILFSFMSAFMVKIYFHNVKIYRSGLVRQIEGKVCNYHPMPFGGHDTERFDVQNIHFEFADDILSDGGYHIAASRGGVIKPDLYARITYYSNKQKNIILRLEIER